MTPTTTVDATRRALIAAFASAPLGGSVAGAAATPAALRIGSRTLVACFSRSGNTRVIAGVIARGRNADLVEIRPAAPYPDAYLATVEQARRERDQGFEPALESGVPGIALYDTIYLGFPIWGETLPPVVRSFLKAHDLSGKILRPFITHGGFGLGNSEAELARHAPAARIEKAFSMQADQERRTLEQVSTWLKVPPR